MAIGPIGNTIFVNQQMASASSIQGNINNKFDLQNVAAQTAINEKNEKVEEVRPAEENHEVDEDREHEKNQADQERKKRKKREDDEEEEEAPRLLDIKV